MTASASLHILIEGFFLEWMERDRKLSENTIASYRDSFSLFLRWLREARGVDPIDISMSDLTADNINGFLNYLAEERGCSAKTLNCRLSAFWSFAGYAARKAPPAHRPACRDIQDTESQGPAQGDRLPDPRRG